MKQMTREQKFLLASNQHSDLLAAGCSASDLRAAGYSASDLLAAGCSASDLLAAGCSASDLLAAGCSASDLEEMLRDVPLIEKPYTRLLADIRAKRRIHKQSTFGPDCLIGNICGTPMCTAGHLIQMAGAAGWNLKKKFGWVGAASLLHMKAHPDVPAQNFNAIPQDWALAYIETMAEREAESA